MKIIECYNLFKEKYLNYIVIIKVGNFYDIYNEDTKIVSYLMKYKVNTNNGVLKLGFPIISLNKVLCILEKEKLSYIILEKEDGEYEISLKKRFNNNAYNEYIDKLKDYNERILKLDKLYLILKLRILDDNFDQLLLNIKNLL